VPDLLATALPEWLSLSLSAGAKAYFTLLSEPQDADVFSLAPGVEGRWTIPTKIPMYLTASFFYSPKILTLGDAKVMYDFIARYEVGFTSSVVGFIGYRQLRYELESEAEEHRYLDDDLHIGVRVAF
jgi:hypothetical protein